MRRTPFARRTRKPLRRTAIRPRAPTKRRSIATREDLAYREWIRSLPCHVVSPACGGAWPVIHAHHVRTRGAGGCDRGNLVPLCAWHHDLLHQIGRKTFAKRFNVDLAADAARLDAAYTNREGSAA